jgi:hypothetical protein
MSIHWYSFGDEHAVAAHVVISCCLLLASAQNLFKFGCFISAHTPLRRAHVAAATLSGTLPTHCHNALQSVDCHCCLGCLSADAGVGHATPDLFVHFSTGTPPGCMAINALV